MIPVTISVMGHGPVSPIPYDFPPFELEGATNYYCVALIEFTRFLMQQWLGRKFTDRELATCRAQLVAWLREMVAHGKARDGMLDWPFIASFSLDYCFKNVDQDYRPIRLKDHVGLDIQPLAERLAAYWIGAR